MKCKGFSLKKADKAVIDEAKNTVTIYNPSDIKFLTAKTIAKTGSNNVIVYNLKEESITYQ